MSSAGGKSKPESPGKIVWFGEFAFNLTTGRLHRGDDLIPLKAQATELLALLVEEAGRVVPHEAIIARLWPAATVEYEAGIHNVVRQVRGALADDPRVPAYVATVPRLGYKFVAPVRYRAREAVRARTPNRSFLIGLAVAAVAGAIAFFAFWLADGASSSFVGRVSDAEPVELEKIRHLLLRHDPESIELARVRLAAIIEEMPRAPSPYTLLAETYLRANPPDWQAAEQAAREALRIDARHCAANRILGSVSLYGRWNWGEAGRRFRQAVSGSCASAGDRVDYAFYLVSRRDFEGAVEQVERATRAAPVEALLRYDAAYVYYLAGRLPEAREAVDEALALDPDSAWSKALRVDILLAQRNWEEASKLIELEATAASTPGPNLNRVYAETLRRAYSAPEANASSMVLASLAGRLGESTTVMRHLSAAISERDRHVPFLMVDPDFQAFWHNTEFLRLVVSTGNPVAIRALELRESKKPR